MVRIFTSKACDSGSCENCNGGTPTAKGFYGGSRCSCQCHQKQQKPITFKDRLKTIDKGRFTPVVEALDVHDYCEHCSKFDKKKEDSYRCACIGSCIGVTLSEVMKNYMKWKLGTITEEEHLENC